MFYTFAFDGLNRKNENAQRNGFRINEVMKLTIEVDENPSKRNICYYLKLPIQLMHSQFLENKITKLRIFETIK